MKKTVLILGVAAIFVASLVSAKVSIAEPTVKAKASAMSSVSAVPLQAGGKLLIDKSDCIGCHNAVNKIIGPSYKEIAKKYPNNEKNINYLADKIIKGGSGVWGQIPMTPHAKISTADAKLMAKYILSLKK